jgi:hypothetical protein
MKKVLTTSVYDDDEKEIGCTIVFFYEIIDGEWWVYDVSYKLFESYNASEQAIIDQINEHIYKSHKHVFFNVRCKTSSDSTARTI